mmetsp:Transcript_9720/g.15942  ORF Transcript_9720/g.15942 Transcript_9720/m.15942 type:complete len:197 (-) Transcript_9720:1190-1780(-)|eukprot:CAMPEP_0203799136 /NCGR_PEP_ID=MMETSP0100_2-20121128/9741_1 /ASSEMBLY_ACC=CAM_ASM_000210 /TAXON_ID=96639 /ORGANISM=" , Strain NY0313808BC1" /LENGTH=196 /DNA_ID=CAMNT_0050704969 /DNA_START=86 /DNA_END=679 /DNA_ORIENTATION=-
MGGKSSQLSSRSKHANVLFVGLDGGGKTAILNRLSGYGENTAHQATQTKGLSIVKLSQLGFKLLCYDVGGSKDYQSTWENYYSKSHVVVFVIDSADRKRIEKAGTMLQMLLEDPKLSGVPLLILANKQDLFSSISGMEVCDGLNCSQIRGRSWQIQQTSALTGEGLQVAFDWIGRTLAERALSTKEVKKMKFALKA